MSYEDPFDSMDEAYVAGEQFFALVGDLIAKHAGPLDRREDYNSLHLLKNEQRGLWVADLGMAAANSLWRRRSIKRLASEAVLRVTLMKTPEMLRDDESLVFEEHNFSETSSDGFVRQRTAISVFERLPTGPTIAGTEQIAWLGRIMQGFRRSQ